MKTVIPRTSLVVRFAGFFVIAGIGLVLIGREVVAKRTERSVRVMLLTVQEALQRYHVDEEQYPPRAMTGTELVTMLHERSFLEAMILNPWTGRPYDGGAAREGAAREDHLQYRTDGLAETYELIVTDPESGTVQFQLDSTEHQSLE
ncbi:MAG: hypothetical protein KBF76_11150 [Verrucomicrobiales bacterium]|nr:hypothetical protein [Verrucomicrobiales bacterium]